MGTKRTMRRVPEDVAEAKYIHGLISADLGARIGQLAQDQKLDEIHTLTTYLQTWSGIVADLDVPEEAATATGTMIGATGSPIAKTPPLDDAKDDGSGGGPALGQKSDPENAEGGSRTNRPARTNRA